MKICIHHFKPTSLEFLAKAGETVMIQTLQCAYFLISKLIFNNDSQTSVNRLLVIREITLYWLVLN